MTRRITLLGATGSIGDSAARVIAADPERFAVHAVTAHKNVGKLARTARALRARHAVIANERMLPELKDALAGSGISAGAGAAALEDAARDPVDLVVSAIVGAAGLRPTAAAVEAGSNIALANKECLICAGSAFMALARRRNVRILPIDSEHNALFQLLDGRDVNLIRRFTITASGGPFRTWSSDHIGRATPEQALAHPTWSMGAKVTVDSATLMNKGLELIEAHHLFGVPAERMDVLIHPQSVVHGLITFSDGSVHAELGAADMRRPISYCLYWPERAQTAAASIDLTQIGQLTFERPDLEKFPALQLAMNALKSAAGAPTVLNAADELAVAAFLSGRLSFNAIPQVVENTLTAAGSMGLLTEPSSIDEALDLDQAAREIARADLQRRHAAA